MRVVQLTKAACTDLSFPGGHCAILDCRFASVVCSAFSSCTAPRTYWPCACSENDSYIANPEPLEFANGWNCRLDRLPRCWNDWYLDLPRHIFKLRTLALRLRISATNSPIFPDGCSWSILETA